MKYILTILAFALIVTANSQIITTGVYGAYSDKFEAGISATITPKNFGMYVSARVGGTDFTGLAGLTYRMKNYPQLLYIALGGAVLDENPNRTVPVAEFGFLFYPSKKNNLTYHFGVGTNDFKTTNVILGLSLKMDFKK